MALQDQTLANTMAKMGMEAKRRRNTEAALAAMQPGIRRRGELPVTLGGLGSLLLGPQGERPGARPVGPYLESTPEPVTPPSVREAPPWMAGAPQFAATQLLRALSDRERNKDRVPSWQMPYPMPATRGERDVLGMLPVAGDVEDVRYLAEGVREGDPAKMLMGGAATALPFVPASLLHTVYHGSPHVFDAFKMSQIGTGEGAQAYGHGLYFAEEPGVAQEYRSQLTRTTQGKVLLDGQPLEKPTPAQALAAGAQEWEGDTMEALNKLKPTGKLYTPEVIEEAKELVKSGRIGYQKAGALYTVEIPDEAVGRMLDWDKPLSEQPESVREALKQWGGFSDRMKGGAIYETVAQRLAEPPFGNSLRMTQQPEQAARASQALQQIGIPGIRYLDQGSRGSAGGELLGVTQHGGKWQAKIKVKNRAGGFGVPTDMVTTSKPYATEKEAREWAQSKIEGGTRNLVLFDESLATILERK